MSVIAHAGGWDEMLITLIVLAVVFALAGRSKRRTARSTGVEAGPCPFCGAELDRTSDRCPQCGFRTKTRNEPASPSGLSQAGEPRQERGG
jgi:predicted amidophosphoribosyltransferase